MNVVIVEDEPLAAQRLEKLLLAYDSNTQVIARIPSVKKAVEWFSQQGFVDQTDVVFMDIHLDDGLGFQVIEKAKLTVPVIFTTAHESYAIQAFKGNSVDYLLKPIAEKELAHALAKFKRIWQKQGAQVPGVPELNGKGSSEEQLYRERFMVTIGSRIKIIEVAKIAYFFYEQKATYLTTYDGQNYVMNYSLDKLVTMVDPHQFYRVNRSYLVSVNAIRSVYAYANSKLKVELEPTSRHEVYATVDRVTEFKNWLGK